MTPADMEIAIPRSEEDQLRTELAARTDVEAGRIKRYLSMPDLSRTSGSPIHELVARIRAIDLFKGFDVIDVPEIMGTDIVFDLFDFPKDHPARSRSDSYFVDDTHVLRTHTTVMWYYWLKEKSVQDRLATGATIGVLSFGKVYRKDEVDRTHMNVFHQIDALFLTPKDTKMLELSDLQEVEAAAVKAIFGEGIEYRFHGETFPYTDPSTEIEIKKGDAWIEILGSGVVKGSVLEKLGVDSTRYNGWAFGFGLERWAMVSMELPDIRLLWSEDERVKRQLELGCVYKEVSKYPAVIRDISFIVGKDFVPNNFFDLVRDVVGDLVEEITLLDRYENAEKLGIDKVSYAYRITYRSLGKTLTNEEVNDLHAKIEHAAAKAYGATIR
jgi:phenylalanyl-tRNA synthetase alpha chain